LRSAMHTMRWCSAGQRLRRSSSTAAGRKCCSSVTNSCNTCKKHTRSNSRDKMAHFRSEHNSAFLPPWAGVCRPVTLARRCYGAHTHRLDVPADVLLQTLHEGDRAHGVLGAQVVGKGALHQFLVQALRKRHRQKRSWRCRGFKRISGSPHGDPWQ